MASAGEQPGAPALLLRAPRALARPVAARARRRRRATRASRECARPAPHAPHTHFAGKSSHDSPSLHRLTLAPIRAAGDEAMAGRMVRQLQEGGDIGDTIAIILGVLIILTAVCAFLGWYSRRRG